MPRQPASVLCHCSPYFTLKLNKSTTIFFVTRLRLLFFKGTVKVTYLGIRSAHERVWLVEEKPIWLPRAYLTRGDLERARGNVHVCKLVRELTNIQIRTVTAEMLNDSTCSCPTNALQLNERTNEGRKEGGRTREKAREKEQLPREGESAQLNTL